MTSVTSDNDDNDVRAEVVRLHREGVSIRGIAELVGLSKSAVGRITVEADELDLDDDSDLDRDVALLTAIDSGEATPPFRFVGMEPTILHHPGCDDGEPVNVERFLDANGRSVSVLDIYRADHADGSEGHGYLADAYRQVEAAGYRSVRDAAAGRWRWERVGERV